MVDTVQRLEPFSTVDRVFVVTGGNHQDAGRYRREGIAQSPTGPVRTWVLANETEATIECQNHQQG